MCLHGNKLLLYLREIGTATPNVYENIHIFVEVYGSIRAPRRHTCAQHITKQRRRDKLERKGVECGDPLTIALRWRCQCCNQQDPSLRAFFTDLSATSVREESSSPPHPTHVIIAARSSATTSCQGENGNSGSELHDCRFG